MPPEVANGKRIDRRRASAGCAALALAFAVCTLIAPIGAPAQTTLAPGITFQKQTRLTVHGPVALNVITAPRPGGLYRLQPLLANNRFGAAAPLTSIESDVSPVTTTAGVNGDFLDPKSGYPVGILLHSGALESAPYDERSSIGVGSDGMLHVDDVSMLAYWQGDGLQHLMGINRVNPAEGATLYTPAFGAATPAASNTVALVFNSFPQATPNVDLVAQVSDIQSGGGIGIPAAGAVLVGSGSQIESMTSEIKVGQPLTIRLALTPNWDGIAYALGGGPALVRDGVPVFNVLEDFAPLELARRQARAAVGQKADGTIVLLAVDGGRPGYSSGMTNFELAQSLVRLGAVTASALGYGAEATMAFDGQLLSRPSSPRGEASIGEALVAAYDGVVAPPPSRPTLSPNGDGVAESETLSYKIVRPSTVTTSLVGPDGVARISTSEQKSPGVYPLVWNGRRSSGAPELEGLWHWTVTATDDLGRNSSADRSFQLNNTLGFLSVRPLLLRLRPHAGTLAIAAKLARPAVVKLHIYDSGGALLRTLVKKVARAGVLRLRWDGRDGKGKLVPSGRYQLRVTASSRYGPAELSRFFLVKRLAH